MSENDLIKLQLCTASIQRVMGVTRSYVESDKLNACKASAIWAAYNVLNVDLHSISFYHKIEPLVVEEVIHDCGITRMTDNNVERLFSEIENDLKIPFNNLKLKTKN